MAKKLNIGVIGMSDGNGHPYSWSAIFNGYDQKFMKDCPFPVIPEYLREQNFPEDGLGHLGEVTHIWTQDLDISNHISKASRIKYVVENMEDMIGEIDAVLLARDDAENHFKLAKPFIDAGLPIFIDKPLALSVEEAEKILELQKYENQVFSCSSIRFADELDLSVSEKDQLGKILHVEAAVPKQWDTYAIHIIEPVLARLPLRGELLAIKSLKSKNIHNCIVKWENSTAYFKVTGNVSVSLNLKFYGEQNFVKKEFFDSYNCFKRSLHKFINVLMGKEENIRREETLEAIRIIEKGR